MIEQDPERFAEVTDTMWTDVERGAWISPCRRYRYTLTRRWGPGPGVTWMMLNPSDADGERDDLTATKCIGFTRRWGYDAMLVVNLFGLISTDPAGLLLVDDPVGQENDLVLRRIAAGLTADRLLVAAWGMHAPAGRVARVLALPGMERLQCLGVTRSGAPRHPSRLAYDTQLEPWPVAS